MCRICSVSCAIIVFGVLVSAYYFNQDRIEDHKKSENSKRETEKKPESSEISKWEKNRDFVILQYEQLSQGLRSRDNSTIIAGTILITASILLLSSCIGNIASIPLTMKLSVIVASLSIYTIWLIAFNLTTKKLNSTYFKRLRGMESTCEKFTGAKYINIHTYNLEKVEDVNWWKYLRRKIWLWLFWVLIGLSIAILSIPI